MPLRLVSRLPVWMAVAVALGLVDFATAPAGAVSVLHVPLLIVAWRLLVPRSLPGLTAILAAAALLPGLFRLLAGEPFEWVRLWAVAALAVAGIYQSRVQLQRRRRIRMRRQLHAAVRRRALQLRRSNRRLSAEVARRQSAQQQLADSEAHLESLIQRLGLHVIRKDRNGVFTYASPSFCRLLGRTPGDVVGRTDTDFYPLRTSRKYRDDDRQVMRSGEPIDTVEINPQPDGSRSYMQVLKAPDYDAAGALIGLQAVFWDVTDRYRNEIELRRSEIRKRALFESTADGILLVDAEGRVVESNASAGRIFATATERLNGRRLSELGLFADDRPTWWQGIDGNRRVEVTLRRPGGEPFPAELTVHAIPLGDREGTALVVRDITDRRRVETELRAAKEAAEAASRAKDRFLAGVSHEIRTPLGAILGLGELLTDSPLSPRQRQYVELISHSAALLQGAIDDILDFSKIQADRLELEREPLDLVRVVGDAAKCLAARAVGKGLELVYDVHPDLTREVAGDAVRIRQVVVNLVGNAVKFTDAGEVVVRLRPAEDGEGAWLDVVDSGIGIPEARRQAIFEAFEQADSSTTRRFGGTGLGLAISDRIIRRMGGRIELESSAGRGSAFQCRLPLRPVAADDGRPRPAAGDGTSGGEVWVLEDNPRQAAALQRTLAAAGYAVRLFDTAADALDAARSGGPDQLVIDAQLEALGSLQPLVEPRPVVWATQLGAMPPSLAGRADPMLVKPILPDELLRSLEPQATAPEPAAPAPREIQGLLLVVDDSPVNRTVIRDLLIASGYRALTAADGPEGIRAAASTPPPDAVLMDLQMPGMDGIEAARMIRAEAEAAGRAAPPIIALTAHATEEHRRRCLEAGLAGYVTKPARRESLIRAIEAALARPPVAAEGAEETPAAPEADWVAHFRTQTGHPDPNGLRGMAEMFLQEVPARLAGLGEGIRRGDASAVHRHAHSLKSCLRYVSSGPEVELARRIEAAGKAERLDEVPDLLAQLTPAVDAWCARVRRWWEASPAAAGATARAEGPGPA